MSFLIKDDKLLKKYNKIWDIVCNITNEPAYNQKIVKNKIKCCAGKTNFHGNGIPKEGSHCICLSVVLNDFAFKIGKDSYP